MPRKNPDDLTLLLIDARREARKVVETKEHRSKLSRHVRMIALRLENEQRQLYTNPANWLATDVVQIILVEPDGLEHPIGVFQELVHRTVSSTRRFAPSAPGAIPTREERVRGQYWETPVAPVEVFETPRERRAIFDRALELLSEVK